MLVMPAAGRVPGPARGGNAAERMIRGPVVTQSAIDRLASTCHELIVEGDSYRRRQRPAAPPVDDPAPATTP